MSVGRIFEASAQLAAARWRPILVIALLVGGPAALLTAAAGMRFNEVALDVFPGIRDGLLQDAGVLTVAEFERLSGALVMLGLATLVAGLFGSIGAVGLSAAVLGPGVPRGGTREALRVMLRAVPSVLAFMLVTSAVVAALLVAGLIVMGLSAATLSGGSLTRGGAGAFVALVIGVALVVLLVYLTLRWAVAYPAMAVEGAGWRTALVRSWRLSADNLWRIAAVVLMGALVTLVGTAALTQLLSVVLVDVMASGLGVDPLLAESVVTAAVSILFAPVAPLLLAVLFVDLRSRQRPAGDEAPALRPPPWSGPGS